MKSSTKQKIVNIKHFVITLYSYYHKTMKNCSIQKINFKYVKTVNFDTIAKTFKMQNKY